MRRHLDAGVSAAQAAGLALAETSEDETMTPVQSHVARPLVEGLRTPTVVHDHRLLDLVPLRAHAVRRGSTKRTCSTRGEAIIRWNRGCRIQVLPNLIPFGSHRATGPLR